MEIGSKNKYPANALSNFAPHPFEFDGVKCSSMEGLLQAFKFKNPLMQEHICTLVGLAAKRSGSRKSWQRRQVLYWKGVEYARDSEGYQHLLDRAYAALASSEGFRRALLASGDAVLTHNIGRTNPNETILTRSEFIRRLVHIRTGLQAASSNIRAGGK